MTARLKRAVFEARRIRKNLVRLRGEIDLGGDCGLASLLLADALADVGTLRHTKDTSGRFCSPHVWNELDGVIIDITATQFNDSSESDDAGEPPVFGVLVTRSPRIYHRPVTGRGRQTLAYLSDVDWYEDQDHRRMRATMERLRKAVSPGRDLRRSERQSPRVQGTPP
jgi:hypothetical protein